MVLDVVQKDSNLLLKTKLISLCLYRVRIRSCQRGFSFLARSTRGCPTCSGSGLFGSSSSPSTCLGSDKLLLCCVFAPLGPSSVSGSGELLLGNDTGQPNPTGSRVRVSSGSGAGHGESTRDPGPTHLKGNSQRRPTKANAGQRRPTAAKEGQCRPTKNRYVFFCNVHFIFYFLFFNYYDATTITTKQL